MDNQKERPKSRQSIANPLARANTTTDISALKEAHERKKQIGRRTRKSVGPGGFETLDKASNALAKLSPLRPRSILKPTVPLTPPKAIPSFDELHQRGTNKKNSPLKNNAEDLLIDFSTPGTAHKSATSTQAAGSQENVIDPFSPTKNLHMTIDDRVSTEPMSQEDEERLAKKKAALEHRAARRKSLANRRVSFAPEATLHTWSVVEMMEDSTTSSASNSTRRQSAMTAAQSPALPRNLATPPAEAPTQNAVAPTNGDVHAPQQSPRQKSPRRRSGVADLADNANSSSPGDHVDSSPVRVEEDLDSESDTDGDTAMSIDEATANTIHSSASTDSQTSLDERLRQAASSAGTRGIQYDEHGSEDEDTAMELAENTITHAFKNHISNKNSTPFAANELFTDKENINPFQQVDGNLDDSATDESTMGMTMEMTKAVGGIIPNDKPKKKNIGRRRVSTSQRQSAGNSSSLGEETMDLTVAKGGILTSSPGTVEAEQMSDEEMTMELTGVVNLPPTRRQSDATIVEHTESMDMTVAQGGILPTIDERTEPQSYIEDNHTAGMDITRAVGGILSASLPADDVVGTVSSQYVQRNGHDSIPESPHQAMSVVASETGSPSLRPRSVTRRSIGNSRSATPASAPKQSLPASMPTSASAGLQLTPSKQLFAAPTKSSSAKRTPVLPNITHRGASPKKLFTKELKERASPTTTKSPRSKRDLLFARDESTGLSTPRVILQAPKPHQHLRKSMSSIVLENTGSPRVAELLSRRSSIGDNVPLFQLEQKLQSSSRLEDPQELEEQIDQERAEDHRRESGRFVMEQEADVAYEENTTQNLRDMIESISPEKPMMKVGGRKSLAAGSARGLLGKRPLELDEDDEESPKRLRAVSREQSPVKKVHLPRPPTKEETTGRLTRIQQLQLEKMASTTPVTGMSPSKTVASPKHTGHFRESQSAQKATSFEEKLDNVVEAADVATLHPELAAEAEEEKVSLQDFLNMTNIHFIELSTTKRRHTIAQSSGPTDSEADRSSESLFKTAVTTMPLLELYQHATRELKSYISSGRKIIKTIESETLTEQPSLFKTYIDATLQDKQVMDNQFRNCKTSARLQSKEGWYQWRSQLVDGLQTGLASIKNNLLKDETVLNSQQVQIDRIVPELALRKAKLQAELVGLRRRLHEHENIDYAAVKRARLDLSKAKSQVASQQDVLTRLQYQIEEKDNIISETQDLQGELRAQIDEANKHQEVEVDSSSRDVFAARKRVEQLEQNFGWKLISAEEDPDGLDDLGVALTLKYNEELRLFFHPDAFQVRTSRRRSGRNSRSRSGPTAPISLTYCPDEDDDRKSKTLSTELRFMLQLLQSQLHGYTMLPRGTVSCHTVLNTVFQGWTVGRTLVAEIDALKRAGIVQTSILGDEKLSCRLMLMTKDRSRFEIDFCTNVTPADGGEFFANTVVTAAQIYGPQESRLEASKLRKVQNALNKEVDDRSMGTGIWLDAVKGFQDWLSSQAESRAQAQIDAESTEKQRHTSEAQSLKTSQQQEAATSQSEDSAPTRPVSTSAQPQSRRGVTSSPARPQPVLKSTTPKYPIRSPLVPKTTNRILRKPAPVSKLPQPVNTVTVDSASFGSSLRGNANSNNENAAFPPSHSQLQLDKAFPQSLDQKDHQKENLQFAIPRVNNTKEAAMMRDMLSSTNQGTTAIVGEGDDDDDVFTDAGMFGASQPAITPAEQEAMMHTPVKRRVGALRRSPM